MANGIAAAPRTAGADSDKPISQPQKTLARNAQSPSLQLSASRALIRGLDTFAPSLAGRLALRTWMVVPRREPPAAATKFLQGAKQFQVSIPEARIKGYEWGAGKRNVLLCHGWEESAASMLGFVSPLVERGCKVTAIDAPGHGASSGHVTSMRRYGDAIYETCVKRGPFDAIVAHSIGASAVVKALATKPELQPRLVLVSGISNPASTLEAFYKFMDLSEPAQQVLEKQVEVELGRPFVQCGFTDLASNRQAPTLLVHDRSDRAAPFSDLQNAAHVFQDVRLHATTGLGHRRILKDPGVVATIVDFVCSPDPSAPVAPRSKL